MATQDQNSAAPEVQKDPELENMDKLTGDVEKNLGADIKRILEDKKQQAKQGKKLKKADIDFEVDTVTPTSKADTKTDRDKKSDESPQSQIDKTAPQPTESKKTEQSKNNNDSPTVSSEAPPIYDHPQDGNGGKETPQTNETEDSSDDFPTVDSDAPPIYDNPQGGIEEGGDEEATEGEEKSEGDEMAKSYEGTENADGKEEPGSSNSQQEQKNSTTNDQTPPIDPTKAVQGDNPYDPMKQGGQKAEMAKQAGVDADDQKTDKSKNEQEIKRQLGAGKKYQSPGTASPNDLAEGMAGGEATPKANQTANGKPGQGKDFQPGGGQVPPQEGEHKKPAEPGSETSQPEADKASHAEQQKEQTIEGKGSEPTRTGSAVGEVPPEKEGAGKGKDEAEGESGADAPGPIQQLKTLKDLIKSVSLTQLIGNLVRVYLIAQGLGAFTNMLDKMLKKEQANSLYTCCCCSSCCCGCLFPFFPLIIAIIAVAAAAS